MRLLVIPPPVQPAVYPEPRGCPSADCGSRHVQFRQAVRQPLRDTRLEEVVTHRYQCPRCGRTFRLYPVGVSHDWNETTLRASDRPGVSATTSVASSLLETPPPFLRVVPLGEASEVLIRGAPLPRDVPH